MFSFVLLTLLFMYFNKLLSKSIDEMNMKVKENEMKSSFKRQSNDPM